MRSKTRCVEIKTLARARLEMQRIGVDPAGITLMAPKQFHHNLKLTGLTPPQANILKQDMLSIGGEAAVAKGVVSCEVSATDCILSGTRTQLGRIVKKLRTQPYGLSKVAGDIEQALKNSVGAVENSKMIFKGRTRSWDTAARILVMGILNVTPDSFSDGGKYLDRDKAVERALEMVRQGADIIDIGGESTRPGSAPVSEDEELGRVMPVVEGLMKHASKLPPAKSAHSKTALSKSAIVLSIDTTKARVAEEALAAGAEIINDVSALTRDKLMAGVVAEHGAGVALMHSRGEPAVMQDNTGYGDLMGEIFKYLSDRIDSALASGIELEKIVVDPGIGFAKSVAGNLEILDRLGELTGLGRPVLVGTSRKSFIGSVAEGEPGGKDGVSGRLSGSLASMTAAVLNGASIVRVHDVQEAARAVAVCDAIKKGRGKRY